jgi:hypothetical protein
MLAETVSSKAAVAAYDVGIYWACVFFWQANTCWGDNRGATKVRDTP